MYVYVSTDTQAHTCRHNIHTCIHNIYISIYIYIYIYIYTYVYTHTYIYTHEHMSTHMFVHICICTYVSDQQLRLSRKTEPTQQNESSTIRNLKP